MAVVVLVIVVGGRGRRRRVHPADICTICSCYLHGMQMTISDAMLRTSTLWMPHIVQIQVIFAFEADIMGT